MGEGIRNNNKAYPNVFITVIPDTTDAESSSDTAYCFMCRKLWDADNAGFAIETHMKNEHGFTDAG